MRTREQIEKACMEPLPASAVSERTQAGTTLSYVDQHYVIRRLCEVFGPLGFNAETVECVLVCEPYESTSSSGKKTWRVGYRAKVRLSMRGDFGETGYVVKEGTGVGQGIDKDLILAHESGAKEAETDALKRAARLLGDSLGLALYQKSQEHVETTPDRIVRLANEGHVDEAKELARSVWKRMDTRQRDAATNAIEAAEAAKGAADAAE